MGFQVALSVILVIRGEEDAPYSLTRIMWYVYYSLSPSLSPSPPLPPPLSLPHLWSKQRINGINVEGERVVRYVIYIRVSVVHWPPIQCRIGQPSFFGCILLSHTDWPSRLYQTDLLLHFTVLHITVMSYKSHCGLFSDQRLREVKQALNKLVYSLNHLTNVLGWHPSSMWDLAFFCCFFLILRPQIGVIHQGMGWKYRAIHSTSAINKCSQCIRHATQRGLQN